MSATPSLDVSLHSPGDLSVERGFLPDRGEYLVLTTGAWPATATIYLSPAEAAQWASVLTEYAQSGSDTAVYGLTEEQAKGLAAVTAEAQHRVSSQAGLATIRQLPVQPIIDAPQGPDEDGAA